MVRLIVLVPCAALFATGVSPQEGGRRGGRGPGGFPGIAIFNPLDTDRDQNLSAAQDRCCARRDVTQSRLGVIAIVNDLHKGRDAGTRGSS